MNTITTWNPLREFPLFAGRLTNLADALCSDQGSTAKSWTPAVEISEDQDGYHIKAELPDVPPADVKVFVREGVLTVQGERKFEKRSEEAKYHLIERSYGSFRRSFTLPKNADGEKVSAEFKAGVLNVTVPKREDVKPKEIEVKVA